MTLNYGVELWCVVKFCVTPNRLPIETVPMIKSTGAYDKCNLAFDYKWHSCFRSRRESINDDSRGGRLAFLTCSIKKLVKDMVQTDRRTTVRTIANELGVSCSTVHGIPTENIGMSKGSAQWVPRLLKENEKECCTHCSQKFLHCYKSEGEDFLDGIITTDETWLHHFHPESKTITVWKLCTVHFSGVFKMADTFY